MIYQYQTQILNPTGYLKEAIPEEPRTSIFLSRMSKFQCSSSTCHDRDIHLFCCCLHLMQIQKQIKIKKDHRRQNKNIYEKYTFETYLAHYYQGI